MPCYAKFMKYMVTEKRWVSFEDDDRMQHCIVIATRSLVQKKEDPGAFTIPCTIGLLHFSKALCDLGESINLMADQSLKRPFGILHNVLVKVE